MSETPKLAAILAADVVGYSRLAGADENRTLARLRGATPPFYKGKASTSGGSGASRNASTTARRRT